MHARMKRGLALLAVPAMAAGLLAMNGGAASAATHAKPHDTAVCNNTPGPTRCHNISSLLLNQNNGPDFVQNATGLGAVGGTDQGRKVNLRQASNTRINEDFAEVFVGTVGQLCGRTAGPGVNSLDPTSYACLNYPDFYPVYQGQFSPDSNESGFCVGALAAVQGYKIRLERCGSPKTFWVADLAAQITVTFPGGLPGVLLYFPLEFGADTSASNPLVLTLNTNTHNPANELFLQQENFHGGQVPDSQMFTLTDPAGFVL